MPLFFLFMTTNRCFQIAALIFITLLSYWSAGLAPFLSLDDLSILDGLQASDLSLKHTFLGGGGDYFRPLIFVSFYFDLNLFGRNPVAFHCVNVAIHLANTLLVYYLALKLQTDENMHRSQAAFLAGLLFGIHPINVEAVLWVAARTDLLCCIFFLLTLLIVVDSQLSTWRSAVAIFLTSLLSLLAKEASIGLVVIISGYWFFQRGKVDAAKLIRLTIAVVCSTILYLFMRSGLQPTLDAGVTKVVAGSVDKSVVGMLFDSFAAFGFYVSKLIYPFPLNFAIVTIDKTLYIAVFVVVSMVVIAIFMKYRQLRLPLLIVVISLIPPLLALHGKLPWTPYAERYTYLSMTGFALLMGVVVSRLPRVAYHFVFAGILLLSVGTMQRVFMWTDSLAFWQDVLNKSPEFPRSYVGVAYELMSVHKYDEAEVLLKKALEMGLDKDHVWQNLATIKLQRGDLAGYENCMVRAAELSAKPTEKYIALINTITKNTNEREAWRRVSEYYLKAYSQDTDYSDGLYNAAKVFMYLGDDKNAIKYFRLFLDRPGNSIYPPFALKLLQKIEQGKS